MSEMSDRAVNDLWWFQNNNVMYIMTRMYHMYKDGEVQEGHETHRIDQHEQDVVLDALKCA
jgi:hypothetical protein